MTFHWPQITIIVSLALNFGIALAKHGQPRSPFNVGFTLLNIVISVTVLYFGGFFG